MSDLYDLEADGGWTSRQPRVAEPTEREWRDAYMPRRSAQVAQRAGYEINPVNRHALDCACPSCPGWYEARARMAVAAQAYAEPVVKPRHPRPLTDVVVPVAVLMMVFSLCAVVVLPVVMPFVVLGTLSLALVAICVCVIAVVALLLVGAVRRATREAVPVTRATTVRGKVLRRR